VTLPDFGVTLNGHSVENEYRKYPLLVYRDITYFPMTWYDTRLLGLEAKWTQEQGLSLEQGPVTSSYVPYTSEHRNGNTHTAEVPTSFVTVKGKRIDNTKEPYPLLSFRDVTYFPLTWRFAHEEFGWDYQWSDVEGLRIASSNPQLQRADLPASAGENGAALFQGYYYFTETVGSTNHIYRAPVSEPSDKREIYSYSFGTTDRHPRLVTYQIRDNTLWLKYHLGGGFTGHDEFVKISEDGSARLVHHRGYLDFKDTPRGTVVVRLGAEAFEGSNLYFSEGESSRKLGGPGLMYGVTYDGWWSLGGVDASHMEVVGEDVYIIASHDPSDANKLYRINLDTNKTEKVVNSSISRFRVIDKKLYYIKDEDHTLYSSEMDGAGERKLSDHTVAWFDSIEDSLFYTTKKETNRFELYQADPKGEDRLVWNRPVADVQVFHKRLVCRLGEDEDYGLLLLDGSGQHPLLVADPISRVLPSDEGVLVQSSRDSSIHWIH